MSLKKINYDFTNTRLWLTNFKKVAIDISPQYPNLNELISKCDTMYAAKGVGLAAPQIGLSIRLFVIDATPFLDDEI